MLRGDRSILLVEDHADARPLLVMLLEHAGLAVEAAASLDEAEEALRRTTFDVVLSDFMVGASAKATAWEQVERLRRLAAPSPVALMSGWDLDAADVGRRGFAFFALKPCASSELLAMLAGTLAMPVAVAGDEGTVRAYFQAIERGDWAALGALCTDDVVYHLPGDDPRFCRTVAGRQAFVAFAEQTFRDFVEPRFEVRDVRALPRALVARYRGTWRAADGGRGEAPGAVVFAFRGAHIASIGVRVDLGALS